MTGTIEVPSEKMECIKFVNKSIKNNVENVTARTLASLVGKILALKPSLGIICQLMTRRLCMTICCRHPWDEKLTMSEHCVEEIEFWYENIRKLNFSFITKITTIPEKIIFSDANIFAGAGFTYEKYSKVVHYMWDSEEKLKSSTWRELKTVHIIILNLSEF